MTIWPAYMLYFFAYGVVLTGVLGLFASWVDRKVTARVQYRVGPPLLQPAIDLVKLLGKETLIPVGAPRAVFLGAPAVGLASVFFAATLLWVANFHASQGFVGDLIVLVYVLTVPSISIIVGGFASGNPLASLGASREMKLVLAYELPFIMAMLVPVVQAGNTFRLGEILAFQQEQGAVALSLSGILALVAAVLCMQGKLALVPFDMPEAETELVGGPLIEYSGPALALFRLMKNMLLFVLPLMLVVLFMGGIHVDGPRIVNGILKCVALVAVVTVIRNTNPRLRIDQAVRFFWGPVSVLAVIALVLAFAGW